MLATYVIAAIGADVIAPFSEREVVGGEYLPWDATYILGTDNQGRDMLSTLLYGGRISITVGIAAVLMGMVLGVGLGVLSGFVGGKVDTVIITGGSVP